MCWNPRIRISQFLRSVSWEIWQRDADRCLSCGTESHIFGHGGARETAAKLGTDFLGEIPLHMAIRETSDGGTPITASDPSSPQAKAFIAVAEKVLAKLEAANTRPAPRIVME